MKPETTTVEYALKPYLDETYGEMIQRLTEGVGGNISLDEANTRITAGIGGDVVVIDAEHETYRLIVGSDEYELAPFTVTKAGGLTATLADIKGKITATSGTIGGFHVGTNDLWGGNAAIGNAATTIVLGNLDGTSKLALGPAADAITIAGTQTGFIVDGGGNFRVGDADSFFKWSGGALSMQLASGETFTISAGGDISLVGADANPAVIRLIDPPSHAENSSEIRFEREAKPTEYWYVKKVPEEHGTQADWFILAPTDELIASAGSDAKIIMGRHPFESNSAYSFSVLVSNFFEVQIGGSGLIDAADSSNFNVRAKLWVLNSGGIEIDLPSGDPTVVFDTGGTDYFTVGVDDTDKKFKINSGGSLGSTSDFEMDSSGNVGIRNDLIIGGTVDGQDIAAMEARITALEGA